MLAQPLADVIMSANRPTDESDPSGKRKSSFRKSDFVIRSKRDDSFSQIDSFKVTAKKAAEAVENPLQPGFPANNVLPTHQMNPMMQGYPSAGMQAFQYTQYNQQAQASWMQGQLPGLQSQMNVNSFSDQMQGQASVMGTQMQVQSQPFASQMQGFPFAANQIQGQPYPVNQMQGQANAFSNQMQGQPNLANQMQGQIHPMANQMQGQTHIMTNQMQAQTHTIANQMQGQPNAFTSQTGNHGPSFFNPVQPAANIAHNSQMQPNSFQMQAGPALYTPGVPQFSMASTFATSTDNATQPAIDDDFSNFSQFGGESSDHFVGKSTVPSANPGNITHTTRSRASNFFLGSTAIDSGHTGANTVPDTAQSDNFQGFTSFDNASSQSETDFAEFSSFAEAPLPNTDGVTSTSSTPAPISNNEFGDFGSFSQPKSTPASSESTQVLTAVKPLPVSLHGKRMNIVVRNNLGAASTGIVHKERPVAQGAADTMMSATQKQTFPNRRSSAAPGLNNLAETLAQAKTQLTAPVIPPPGEQKDFSILQEVVNSIDKSSIPPLVQQPGSSFTLPDTPTQLAEIFPKCTLKSSKQDSFQDFAAFSSVKQDSQQPADFAAFSSVKQDSQQPADFAAFSSVKQDSQQPADFAAFSSVKEDSQQPADFAAFSSVKQDSQQPADFAAFSSVKQDSQQLADFAAFSSVKEDSQQPVASTDESFGQFADFSSASQPAPSAASQVNNSLQNRQKVSNNDSFTAFTNFSAVKQKLESENSFGGFADFSSSKQDNAPKDNSSGGFADFSSAPAEVISAADDTFGSFASLSVSDTPEHQAPPPSATQHGNTVVSEPSTVKSHAVDWSAFSALDELRAEEEEENLGDFSVFGTTLKSVSSVEQIVQQPDHLLSPDQNPPSSTLDLSNSSNYQPILFDSTNQVSQAEIQDDDWAEFAESTSAVEQEATQPFQDGGDWAQFSEAAPAEDLLAQKVVSTPQPPNKPLFDLKHMSLNLSTPYSEPEHGIPRVSSKTSFDKPGNDPIADNDSDWSGFAEPATTQPDNISSDWSFKDTESVHEDGKSVSSGGITADLSKVTVDWSESLKTNSDWTLEVPSLADVQSPEEDEWAAFGAINRSNQDKSSEIDSRSRSSTVKESAKPASSQGIQASSASFAFSSSPPPFTPGTPATPVNFDFMSEQAKTPTAERASETETITENNWSDFGAFSDQPVALDSEPNTPVEPLGSIMTSEPIEFSPPPVDSNDENWGEFGSDSRDTSQSPKLFGPPPLTDRDFSPHKSVTRAESDWFSLAKRRDSPLVDSSSSSSDQIAPQLATPRSTPENHLAEDSLHTEFQDSPFDPVTGPADDGAITSFIHPNPVDSTNGQLELVLANADQLEVSITNSNLLETTIVDSDQSGEVLKEAGSPENEEDEDSFVFHQPPPLTDDTPGDEIPPFPVGHHLELEADDEEFAAFGSPPPDLPEEDEMFGKAINSNVGSDVFSNKSSTDSKSLDVDWGMGDSKHGEIGSPNSSVSWGFQADEENKVLETGDDVVTKDNDWISEVPPLTAEDADEDWGFRDDEASVPNRTSDVPETSSIASDEMAGDWTFHSSNNGANDDDRWSFKSPVVGSPVASPPPMSPAVSPAAASPPPDDADFGDFPDDDADFGDFPDEDEFQEFGGTKDSEPTTVDYVVPQHSSPPVQATGDKVTMLLNSAFKVVSPSERPTISSHRITDSITRNNIWTTLRDLNQSVSLQLQWKDSESHVNLLSSLHIPMTSTPGLMGGGLTPVKASSAKSSHMLQPSSILPSSTHTVANGDAGPFSQRQSPREKRERTNTVDLLSTIGAAASGVSSSSASSKGFSTDFNDLL